MRLLVIRHGESEADLLNVHEVSVPLHASVYEQESALMFRYRAEFILSKILAENETRSTRRASSTRTARSIILRKRTSV